MAYHRIRIRLRGCNEFTEKFQGGSVADAKALARSRYPDAQYISWIGTAQSDEQEEKNRQWSIDYKKKVDENNERVFGQSGRNAEQSISNVSHSNSNISPSSGGGGNGCGTILVVGFVGIAVAVVTLPLIAAVWTGKFTFGKARERGMKMPLTLLLTLLASSGGMFGTVALYDKLAQDSETLPSQSYVEFIRGVTGN